MILNIKMNEIQELATNGKAYAEGRQFFADGHIREMIFDTASNQYQARIYDPEKGDEYTTITVNKQGRPIHASCSCSDFKQFVGCCSHLVASMLLAEDTEIRPGQKKNLDP
ncbi:MAG TPA: SWIM zinc finger family protein [Clostridiaceae bacterium]|nr:SWIM zinc finger family protein [Clostridiaceae bacterium]